MTDARPSAGNGEVTSGLDRSQVRRAGGRGGGHGDHAEPCLEGPLRLPGRRPGGQHVVADDHARPGAPARARRRSGPASSASSRPGWPPGPPRRGPAWSATRRRKRSIRSASTSYDASRRRAPRAAGDRPGRVVATGPRWRVAKAPAPAPTGRRRGRGRRRRRPPPAPAAVASGPAQPVHRALLVAQPPGPGRPFVGRARPRRHQPGRHGGRPREPRWLVEGRRAPRAQQPAGTPAAHAP